MMKAPSPLCLQLLRSLAYPSSTRSTYHLVSTRQYSTQRQPSPPPQSGHTPGFRLRDKKDDDTEHQPQPLSRPIGLPYPPGPGQNTGLDHRSLKKRRDDFVDYDKHLVRRSKMTKQISKPYFKDWSNMRFHKGKVFLSPERLFRKETALHFPNFFGRTLQKGLERRDRKDGYRGLGRDTSTVMRRKVSVVNFVTSEWAVRQVGTFFSDGLDDVIRQNSDVAQMVDINYENNLLKYWIWRLFGLRRLRKTIPEPEMQGRYFLVRRGFSDEMKEAMGVLNEKAGYVYLVDGEGKIRWAGSAVAGDGERESLVRGVRKLIAEARGERVLPKEKAKEVVTHEEMVEEKRAAVG